jgi:hypothetical protein
MNVAMQCHALIVINEAGDAVTYLNEPGLREQRARRVGWGLGSGGKVQGKKRKENC